jgi:glycosyltransferase involved in cell wall biosynthesis
VPKISIAMATYNGARHIRQQLESFRRQTLLPDELIVSDDASRDGTVEIVEDFARTAPFETVVLKNSTQLGYSRNFEKALLACSGGLIFLSDQDDGWLPEKLATIAAIFAQHPDLHCVLNDMAIADSELKPTGVTVRDNVVKVTGTDANYVHGCAMAITRAWRDFALPLPAEDVSHDGWLGSLALRAGVRRVHPQVLQNYRRHDANASVTAVNETKAKRPFLHRDLWRFLAGETPHDFGRARKNLEVYRGRFAAGLARDEHSALRMPLLRAKERLDREIGFIESRAALLALPRHRRLLPIVGLLRSGEYRSLATGAMSAMKDLLGAPLGAAR